MYKIYNFKSLCSRRLIFRESFHPSLQRWCIIFDASILNEWNCWYYCNSRQSESHPAHGTEPVWLGSKQWFQICPCGSSSRSTRCQLVLISSHARPSRSLCPASWARTCRATPSAVCSVVDPCSPWSSVHGSAPGPTIASHDMAKEHPSFSVSPWQFFSHF